MFDFASINFNPTIVIFYWAYLGLIFFYLIFSFLIFYHLIRFGFFSFANIAVMVVFALISAWLLWFSVTTLSGFDWSVPILGSDWTTGIGSLVNGVSDNLPQVKF